jgi:hypothetical protein
MIKNTLASVGLIAALTGGMSVAHAAEMTLSSGAQEVGLGKFQVEVRLDTQNETVNAVEGVLVFPQGFLVLNGTSDGDSAVNFWLQKPKLESAGRLTFSGIIPGGLSGNVKIFSAAFRALKEGEISLRLTGLKVLLNDGEGTAAKVGTEPYVIKISREANAAEPETGTAKDAEPPEPFNVELVKREDVFDGKWFIVFATQDKQSGVDHFEVAEYKPGFLGLGGPSAGDWVFADSPYVLKDQKLRSDIRVKAVDAEGNERIAFMAAPGAAWWEKDLAVWVIILGLVILCSAIFKKVYGKKKSKIRRRA